MKQSPYRTGDGLGTTIMAMVVGLSLLTPAARAASGTTGSSTGSTATAAPLAPDVQAANNMLTAEQLLGQFYTANAGQPYLVSAVSATPAPGTPSPITPAVGPATTGGTGSSASTGAPINLTATLAGSGEVPSVNNSASATASFTLSADQQTMSYTIQVSNLSGPATAVRIRQGSPGVAGGIVLYELNLPVNGVSSGQFTPRPQDIALLLGGNTYLEIVTAQNQAGEIRGQLLVSNGSSNQPGVPTPTGTVTPPATTPTLLGSLVQEISNDHSAHVAMLQQELGASAAPAPAFQNLTAPTVTQFLTMAIALEDFAVGVDQNAIVSLFPGAAPASTATSPALNGALDSSLVAILADNGRHAGGLRSYRKVVSPVQGGDLTTTLTQNGTPFNIPITVVQMNAFLQVYLTASGGVTTSPPAGGTTGAGAGTTTGTGSTTGGTPGY